MLCPRKLTEAEFQRQVVQLAKLLGWSKVYHTHDSRRSASGYPDLHLVRPGRHVFAELKVGRNGTTADQDAWIEALRDAGCEVYLWRPENWNEIVEVLR